LSYSHRHADYTTPVTDVRSEDSRRSDQGRNVKARLGVPRRKKVAKTVAMIKR